MPEHKIELRSASAVVCIVIQFEHSLFKEVMRLIDLHPLGPYNYSFDTHYSFVAALTSLERSNWYKAYLAKTMTGKDYFFHTKTF